jgi:hypothetical protein
LIRASPNKSENRPAQPVYLLRPPPPDDRPPDDPEDDRPPEPADERGALDRDDPDLMVPDEVRAPEEFDDGRMARVGVRDG